MTPSVLMPRKRQPTDYITLLRRLAHAGVSGSPPPNHPHVYEGDIESVEERVRRVLGLVNRKERKPSDMLFFVMYDIESNKVRRLVAKYLEQKGCTRVQRSIFLADLSPQTYHQIRDDLAEVQAAYDNHDSILVVPVSTEQLKAMKVIGQRIDIDIITHSYNTLFF